MKTSHESELERCRILLYGVVQNEAIKGRISAIYTEERLGTGHELYQTAKTASSSQVEEKLQSAAASRLFNELRDEIHEGYVRVRNAARYFFKDDQSVYELLLLDQKIRQRYADWRKDVTHTFKVISQSPALLDKLTLVGFTAEVVSDYLVKAASIDQLRLNAEIEDGEAQEASVKKYETMSDLQAYCADLRECLDLFYHGSERQVLECVGITVK